MQPVRHNKVAYIESVLIIDQVFLLWIRALYCGVSLTFAMRAHRILSSYE